MVKGAFATLHSAMWSIALCNVANNKLQVCVLKGQIHVRACIMHLVTVSGKATDNRTCLPSCMQETSKIGLHGT